MQLRLLPFGGEAGTASDDRPREGVGSLWRSDEENAGEARYALALENEFGSSKAYIIVSSSVQDDAAARRGSSRSALCLKKDGVEPWFEWAVEDSYPAKLALGPRCLATLSHPSRGVPSPWHMRPS